jgi:hypothetical protein
MAKRYQHVTDPMLHDIGRKIGDLLWGDVVDQDLAQGVDSAAGFRAQNPD